MCCASGVMTEQFRKIEQILCRMSHKDKEWVREWKSDDKAGLWPLQTMTHDLSHHDQLLCKHDKVLCSDDARAVTQQWRSIWAVENGMEWWCYDAMMVWWSECSAAEMSCGCWCRMSTCRDHGIYTVCKTLPQHDKGIGHLHRDLVVCNLWWALGWNGMVSTVIMEVRCKWIMVWMVWQI